MRLICPNCDAQYEVDAAAIPLTGRDVQCSSCGHAWFQLHPDMAIEEDEDDLDETAVELPASEPHPISSPDPVPEPVAASASAEGNENILAAIKDIAQPVAPVAETEFGPSGSGADPQAERAAAAASEPDSRPVHQVDENLMAILREEAAREQAARRSEPPPRPLETQPDLGLPPVAAPVSPSVIAARERFADLSVTAPEEEADARPSSRRELLPDIEEINSTLRATSEPRGEAADTAQHRASPKDSRTRFRIGFILAIAAAVGLWTTYTMAPRIVTRMPASEASMIAYVETVNRARIGVNNALQAASRQLRRLSGEDGGEAGS